MQSYQEKKKKKKAHIKYLVTILFPIQHTQEKK